MQVKQKYEEKIICLSKSHEDQLKEINLSCQYKVDELMKEINFLNGKI